MAWEQIGNSIKFYATFIASKVGKSGLTPTVYVNRAGTTIVTAGNAVEVDATNLPGLYSYELAGVSVTVEGEYIAQFRTADATVDQQHIYSLWIVGRAGVEDLDATVSSRLPTSSYTAPTTPPTTGAIADAVWDETLSGHAGAGSAGAALSAAGGAGDPLLNPVGSYVAPQAGYYLQRLANNQVQIVSSFDPVTMTLTYYYGDDYKVAENREQDFTTTLDLTGGSVALKVRTATALVSIPCTLPDAHTYRLELTAENLESIGVGVWTYDLQMTLANGDDVTEIYGAFMVNADVR